MRHTGFFTGKVKAFSTQRKGPQKVVFSGKWLKKCFPFVFASAFMFTACSENRNSADQDEYRKIYAETVDNFHLNDLEGKEPLSFKEIQELMKGQNTPVLNDTNYNHCPENVANFWEIVKNGIAVTKELQNDSTLTAAQKKEIRTTMVKMLSRVSRYKGSKDSIDITDYNNRQVFVWAEKENQFKDEPKTILETAQGDVDERNEFVGRYYKDFEELAQKAEKYPGVERFAQAFYLNADRFLLAHEDMKVTKPISKRMFDEWCVKNGIKDKNFWMYTNSEKDDYCNRTAFWYKRGVRYGATIHVDPKGNHGAPVYAVVQHEIMHLFQFHVGSNEMPAHNALSDEDALFLPESSFFKGNYLDELGPSLFSLMWEDLIYKEAHGIPKNKIVDYGVVIDTGERKVDAGELAVKVQNWVDASPSLSMDKILSQRKVLEYFNYLGGGQKVYNAKQVSCSEMCF